MASGKPFYAELKKLPAALWLGLGLILLSLLLDVFSESVLQRFYIQQKSHEIKQELWRKETQAEKILKSVRAGQEDFPSHYDEWLQQSRQMGIQLYIYHREKLLFWTDRSVFPLNAIPDSLSMLQRLENGIYLQKNIWIDDYLLVTLVPLQYNYTIQNQYLQNRFVLSCPSKAQFKISDAEGNQTFFSKNGHFLFSLNVIGWKSNFEGIGWLYGFGWLLILWAIRPVVILNWRQGQYMRALNYLLATLLLAIVAWRFALFPEALQHSELFNPAHYATSALLPSLGDLLILTLLISWLIWMTSSLKMPLPVKGLAIFWLLISLASGCLFVQMVSGLVLDSNISFTLNNIYSLSRFSALGLAIVFTSLLNLLSVCLRTVYFLKQISERQVYLYVVSVSAAVALLTWPLHLFAWEGFVFVLLTISLFYETQAKTRKNYWRKRIFYLLMGCLLLSVLFFRFNGQKTLDSQHSLATRLSTERDPVAEYLFENLSRRLQSDVYAKAYFHNPLMARTFLQRRIEQLYFTGYFDKYELVLSTFTKEGIAFKNNDERELDAILNIEDQELTLVRKNLFFANNFTGLPAYLAVIPIRREGKEVGTLALHFQLKTVYEESIYPELLLADDSRFKELQSYSYGIYNGNRLVTQRGDFIYPDAVSFHVPNGASYGLFKDHLYNYNHLVQRISPEVTVVVSYKIRGPLSYVATYAFLVFYLAVFVMLIYLLWIFLIWVRQLSQKHFRWPGSVNIRLADLPFRTKILASIVAAMSMALLLIAFITIRYIVYEYNRDAELKLKQKTRLLTARFEQVLQNREQNQNPVTADELEFLVKELSEGYQTDLNLFDSYGQLVTTTQPGIFEEGIQSPRMSPVAFLAFQQHHESMLVSNEKIGLLHYNAAYMPLRNRDGYTIGFINLPFFTRDKELNERLSSFVVALVNLYILLFFILIAIGIFISRALTAPLDIIRHHLRETGLGRPNRPITWHNNDEIGKLVREYNSMVVALQESAMRLAQSEREGAWKEMAKQVAHEIKNPLTPMKLNIQRLQRAWNEESTELDALVPRVTDLLIRQIDTLSSIATEFSAFAKMPAGVPERVHVQKEVKHAADLFRQQAEAEIILQMPEEPLYLWIDIGHFSRVLNNLLKNALQAIPEGRKGKMVIHVHEELNRVYLEVKDNGAGIPEDVQAKIFTPNFSTKTSGMGLGLAIIKGIIEKAGGEIKFDTIPSEGTTFTFWLPKG